MNNSKHRYYEFGEFRLDAYERQLLKHGQPVPLTFKAFEVLLVLVESSGRILEKEELMQRVWPDAIVEESNLKNNISALRKALGDASQASQYIQTLPRRGYRLVAEVVALPDERDALVIEKHTTTEIIIETISDDETLTDAEVYQEQSEAIISNAREAVATGAETLQGATGEEAITGIAVETETRTAQRVSVKESLVQRVQRRKWLAVVGAGALLIVVAVGGLALSRWISHSNARPSYAFDNMQLIRLTNAGNLGAIISPDGKYIVYVVRGTQADGLWIRQTVSESAVKLLPPTPLMGISFGRDSNFVYYVRQDEHPEGELYKIPVLGGTPKLVLERIDGPVSFSPDGQRMAFRRMNKDVGKLMLITTNLDGGDERILMAADTPYTIWRYNWSPDSNHIALAIKHDAVEGQITWQVIEIPAEGGEVRAITAPQKESITGITWLPDGGGMILIATDKATGVPQLWHLTYPSGQITRITNDSNTYSAPYSGTTVTADGDTILAPQLVIAQNIWLADIRDVNHPRKITADGSNYGYLTWTSDGRILYSEGDRNKSDLWMMNADGMGRERLTEVQSDNRYPAMSPDGRYVLYCSKRTGNYQIWRMDRDGRNPKQLTDEPDGCASPHITPDSQWVVYQTLALAGGDLRKLSIEGGQSVSLADNVETPVISPDGQMVAYQFFDEAKKRFVIVIKPLTGGEPVKVLDYPEAAILEIVQWCKDGLFCLSNHRAQIILVPLDGHPPRPFTDFKTGENISSFAVSADGSQIAIARGVLQYDAILITNIKKR